MIFPSRSVRTGLLHSQKKQPYKITDISGGRAKRPSLRVRPPQEFMAKKKTRLQKAYASFNRQYFKNVLPADMDIAWELDSPRDRYLAYVSSWVLHAEGEKIELPFIRINKRLRFSSTLWKFSLLHEMNHLYVGRNRGHGPAFQKGMMRLAKLGALKGLW